MRIGIDARMYSPKFTGIGRYVKELVDHICKLDQINEYIFFFNEDEYNQFMPPTPRISKRRVNAQHYSWREQTGFVRDLNRENLDLVHFTHFNAPVLYKRPYLVTIHDLTLSKFPDEKRTSTIQKIGYQITIKNVVRRARRIITVSESTKLDAIKMLGAKADKIRVIYEGVGPEFKPIEDEKIIAAVKQKYGVVKPFILYIGAWRRHKNLVNLVKAFNLFRNRYSIDCQLAIGGNNEANTYPEVNQAIEEMGLRGHIVTPGYIMDTDLPALYSAATMFILPSFYEGFGLPLLEAMACGTPVIASNSSSIPEICGDGNAILFDPNDINQIAENMYTVYTSKENQEKLSVRGIERAKKFSWEQMSQQILQVYTEVSQEITAAAKPKPAPLSPTAVPNTPQIPTPSNGPPQEGMA